MHNSLAKIALDPQFQNRILVVEDEPTNMAILSAYLQDAGYHVTEAADGQIAWRELQHDAGYDLIVADRNMPNMDGLELSSRVKKSLHLKHIPVIMQTAMTAPHQIAEGIQAGVFYYLTKPYEPNVMLTLISQALRSKTQGTMFEQRLTRQNQALENMTKGEFRLSLPEEAENVALILGGLFKNAEPAVVGLYELMLNAIEHGHARIGFAEKGRLLSERNWENELHQRLLSPENRNKQVHVMFEQIASEITITITDEGEGFDWRPFLQIEPARATQSNGRGIAKANMLSFDKLSYNAKGNQVIVKGRAD